jgi:uncharacterized Zn finger protein
VSFQDYGPPRRVEGGLKARSARGAIGESWWSRRFIDVLESFALGTRLTRGRAYARRGQVISLDVAPGVVSSSVQGSRVQPYAVTIRFAVLPAAAWTAVERALRSQALYSARLLAGEMPPEIEEVFAAAGAPLFPSSVGELTMRCSCPDWTVPCKHLAATFYLLAEAFDADPFQILRWRGRDRDDLLGHLRGSGQAVLSQPRSPLASVPSPPLAEAVDRFWVPPVPLPARPPTLAAAPDLLLRQLPTPPADLGGETLVRRLRSAYERFATREAARPTQRS